MSIPLQGASPSSTNKVSGYSNGSSSPSLSEHSNSLNIDLENLPLPSSAPQGSVEALIMRGCAEILIESSSHSLKAVELANTLRARVRQTFLAIRERWGSLWLCWAGYRVFRVRRIPKNDTVALVLPGDSDTDSSPRSRRGSRDGLSDSEKDSFGRPPHTPTAVAVKVKTEAQESTHQGACIRCHTAHRRATLSRVREVRRGGGLVVAHRSRRFAFVTFVTIEQAISAKQRLVKLTPWKSAISYAHKESIALSLPRTTFLATSRAGTRKNGMGGATTQWRAGRPAAL